MSEFTEGILLLKKHQPLAERAVQELQERHLLRVLNEKWLVLLVQHLNIQGAGLRTWVIKHSHHFPMLHFVYAEDHGWGYNVFANGELSAHLFVSYEIREKMWLELAEELLPDEDDVVGHLRTNCIAVCSLLYKEVESSKEYQEKVKAQYHAANPKAFTVFDLPEEAITQLREILTGDYYLALTRSSQVGVFQRILDIDEMHWMAYRYVVRDDKMTKAMMIRLVRDEDAKRRD